ncbi:MAG: hypothetical protein K2X81_05345 [Candidatus Obscuribacterales bacterium]|nr:hypothetical protein [Candidatus Obscuribacterales bacterium]
MCNMRDASTWIINPVVDLFFCCGGLLWGLLLLHAIFAGGPTGLEAHSNVFSVALCQLLGVMLFADPHNAATLLRLYGKEDLRSKYSGVAYGGGLSAICLAIMCMNSSSFLVLAVKMYVILIWQHLSAQAYGVAMIYCGRHKFILDKVQTFLFKSLFNSIAIYVIVRQLSSRDFGFDSFLGISLPQWTLLPSFCLSGAEATLLVSFICFCAMFIRKAMRERRALPLPVIMIIITMLVAAFPQRGVFDLFALYLPAFFHSTQYLVVTTFAEMKERRTTERAEQQTATDSFASKQNFEYWGTLVFGGIAIYLVIPLLCNKFAVPFQVAAAAVFCAVNLHHFVVDSMIWKLRDPHLRAQLSV